MRINESQRRIKVHPRISSDTVTTGKDLLYLCQEDHKVNTQLIMIVEVSREITMQEMAQAMCLVVFIHRGAKEYLGDPIMILVLPWDTQDQETNAEIMAVVLARGTVTIGAPKEHTTLGLRIGAMVMDFLTDSKEATGVTMVTIRDRHMSILHINRLAVATLDTTNQCPHMVSSMGQITEAKITHNFTPVIMDIMEGEGRCPREEERTIIGMVGVIRLSHC